MRHSCNLVTSSQNRNDKNSTTSNLKDASSKLVEITLAIHSGKEDNRLRYKIEGFQRQPGTVLSCGASVAVLYRGAIWCSRPLPRLELLPSSRVHWAASSHDRTLIREKRLVAEDGGDLRPLSWTSSSCTSSSTLPPFSVISHTHQILPTDTARMLSPWQKFPQTFCSG